MSDSSMRAAPVTVSPSGAQPSARRERLREFQAELAERLRRAQTAPLASNRLGLAIGSRRLLVDLADAGEILVVPDITPVPLTKDWYRGLANVRGNLVSVIDLSLFAGGPATPLDKESRVLALASDLGSATGILVSRMLGLRSAADLTATPESNDAPTGRDPATRDLFAPWLRGRFVDAQRGAWHQLDLAALTGDARFLDVARS